jgi:putative transposase
MRKSRFSEEQKVKMVGETEQSSVAEVAKKHGVSVKTLYRWRRAYGGMELFEVKRLKQLEQENARLKKLLAERDLEVEPMKEIAAKKW